MKSNQDYRGTDDSWPIIWRMLPAKCTVLDVGCGEHVWGDEWTTVSRCDSGQRYADGRRLDGVEPVDLNGDWPYLKDEFDCVVAADVIEHLENMWHFFREAMRVARKYVIVSTPNVGSMMSRTLYRRSGNLWGFYPDEVEKSGHITPIFMFQLRQVERHHPEWSLIEVDHSSMPVPKPKARRLGIPEFGGRTDAKRGLIVRFERRDNAA